MLCDFHRKQAWQRFVRTHAQGLRRFEDTITEDMDRIAYSMSPAEFHCAVQRFKDRCVHIKRRPRRHFPKKITLFRDYYTTSAVLRSRLDWWLEEPEMWVLHFRSVVSFGNTNNGVEALNRVLKENVLQHRKNNAVSFLLTVSYAKLHAGSVFQ